MELSMMAKVARQKGLHLLGTGDFTHPLWLKELQTNLVERGEGLFTLKNKIASSVFGRSRNDETNFLLSVEISCIYSQNGKGRRIHNVVLAPSFSTVEKINKELILRGANLSADGRPIIGLSSKNLLELILEIDSRCLLIPSHIWTPWFGVYGVRSGFNSLTECFEEFAPYVYGIETGISSDPAMNWQIGELQYRSILSFSDAHSPAKMGREATVFEVESLSYENIRQAIIRPNLSVISSIARDPHEISPHVIRRNDNVIAYTIEFYPEEGRYHYGGHRNCHVVMTPEEQRKVKGICPVCGKPVTDGVLRRVWELAEKKYDIEDMIDETGVNWITDPTKKHPPFVKLIPLLEIVAESVGTKAGSKKAQTLFQLLCAKLGSELDVLLQIPLIDIQKIGGEKIAEGIRKVREGDIIIIHGYDGVYGTVSIWQEKEQMTPQLELVL